MTVLQMLLFGVTALAGTLVVLTRSPRHQALALSLYGLVLALLFAALQAPEAAMAQVAVGSVALPLMVLVALASTGPKAMNATARLILFGSAAAILLPMLLAGLLGLPEFGEPRRSYGEAIGRVALTERHVTNLVSAVVFDYRGLDTLGEEFIMFAAVAGILLLLRGGRGRTGLEPAIETRAWAAGRRSDATTALGRCLLGALALLGLYVVAHGHLTPGGGFQAGVMIAGAFVLIFLTDGYPLWHRWTPNAAFDSAEAASAGAFVVMGFLPWLTGAGFLANVLPLGRTGELLSGGTIPLLNLVVGIEVAAAFVLLFAEFLQETRRLEPGDDE